MSHMRTWHVGQTGWVLSETLSALGTAHVLSIASPLDYTNFPFATQSSFRLAFHYLNVAAVFALVKVGLGGLSRTNGGFPFECPATMRARTGGHVGASHAILHRLYIGDAQAFNLVSIKRHPSRCDVIQKPDRTSLMSALGQ